MKTIFTKLSLASLAIAFAAVIVPVAIDAQIVLRNQSRFSKRDVSSIIQRAEQSSDKFRTDFRRQINSNNRLSNSQKNEFNGNVADCEQALDRLRQQFDRDNNWWTTRSQVQDVVEASQRVNTMMTILPFRRNLERQWNQLRSDINTLADTYDLPGLNGGGWNGGGGGGGGGNVPNWATGTFYGRSQSGENIVMSVSQNGSVTLVINGGNPAYASMNGTTLTNGPYVSRVTRLNNGIRTTSTSNNDYIDYYRDQFGGGGGGGGGNVPSWATGTFYGRSSQTGENVVLTVSQNGSVTIIVNNGEPAYASLNGNILTNGPYISRVSQLNNGIRTTNTSNSRDYIDYYRDQFGGGDGGGGNVPNWATGTFYGRSQSGENIVLTVAQNGTVTIVVNGSNAAYGSLNGTTLTNGPYVSRVSRIRNGIRTTNTSNSNDYIDYYRR